MHANTITITPEQLEMIKADITTQVIKSLTGQDLRSVPAEKRCIRSEEGQPIQRYRRKDGSVNMGARRKDKRAEAMYEMYQQGKSLSEVAAVFGVTRQSVYKIFSRRGYALRPLPIRKPYQEFNGNKYTRGKNGYYRKTYGNRSLMHRDVWEFYNGPIPDGWDIHHKDGDKSNNDISNLECLPKSEHTRLYSPHNNQYTKGRKRYANA